jgi:Ran GTPase-activating protein (RanGAP) involved in mRNA processing and transport
MSAWGIEELRLSITDGKCIDEDVTELDLEDNILKDDLILPLCQSLSNNKSITWINFRNCEINSHMFPVIFQALATHPALTHLKLNGNYGLKAKQLEELLAPNSTLTKLNLGGCDIKDEGLIDLLRALEHNTTLKSINLSANNIAIEKSGSKMLSEILKLNRLTKLNLKLNHFHHYDTKSIKFLSEGLRLNTSLTSLNLGGNWIESVGYQWLAEGLKAHPTLTALDLSGSDIKGAAKWLGELLTHNRVLKNLNLNYSEMNEEACRELALRFSHLDEVKLEKNAISEKGVNWLVQGLTQSNSQLKKLNLMHNTIGSNGCSALCTALKTNSTLQHLDIRFNKIGADASEHVRDMLRVNKGLRELYLSSNDLDASVIMAALPENSVLRELDADDLHQEIEELLEKNIPDE